MSTVTLSSLPLKRLTGLFKGTGKFLAWTIAVGDIYQRGKKQASPSPETSLPSSPSSLSRRLVLGGGGLAALAVADQLLDSRATLGLATPSYAVPERAISGYRAEAKNSCDKKDAICNDVSTQVIDASNRWISYMQNSDKPVPDYVDAALAIKIIGIESVMNPDARAGSYEGLAQFNLHSGKFPEVAKRVTTYINAVPEIKTRLLSIVNTEELEKARILAKKLAEKQAAHKNHKTAKGKHTLYAPQPVIVKFTPRTEVREEDLARTKIFHDTNVQTAALMYGMTDASTRLQQFPDFMKQMPLPYIHALLYMLHNLPKMAIQTIIPHFNEEKSAAELVKSLKDSDKFSTYFSSNSGLYTKDGIATSREIMHRIASLLQEPFKKFYTGADKGDSKYDLPAIRETCRSRRSLIGWLACHP